MKKQSLYWYFISNFPKASDLSKNIDKNAGAERKVIGKKIGRASKPIADIRGGNFGNQISGGIDCSDITEPSTELAKKYDGYKYSISPLKQTNETIMIFQKPYKTGSCLHDTLSLENGDNTCSCGALNIDGNRVGSDTITTRGRSSGGNYEIGLNNPDFEKTSTGRFPAQTFVDSEAAEVLDKQSGNLKGGGAISKHTKDVKTDKDFAPENHNGFEGFNDNDGCSKILHKCEFETGEYDLYHYCPKVSNHERNAGCEEFDEKEFTRRDINQDKLNVPHKKRPRLFKNSHPTLKPIPLNHRILSLFKTPNNQKIIYPFAGSGSEIIGGLKAGFDNYDACEINQEYIDIAEARIKYWTSIDFNLEAKDKEVDKIIQKNNTIDVNNLF